LKQQVRLKPQPKITITTGTQLAAALKSRGLLGTIRITDDHWRLASHLAILRRDFALLEDATDEDKRRLSPEDEIERDTLGAIGEIAIQMLLRKEHGFKPGTLLAIKAMGAGDDFSLKGDGFDIKTVKRKTSEAQINKAHHDTSKGIDYYLIVRLATDGKSAALYCFSRDIVSSFEVKNLWTAYYACSLKRIVVDAEKIAEWLATAQAEAEMASF